MELIKMTLSGVASIIFFIISAASVLWMVNNLCITVESLIIFIVPLVISSACFLYWASYVEVD